VYVRSGPGSAYYEIGHLAKGDLVQVADSRPGWYHILPPNGAYCMIAKEYVDTNDTGQAGTVKGDYINLRAGTALYKNRDPSAVLCVLRKGTKLTILGSTDKYYQVAPTDHALFWISSQFVTPAAAGTEYKIPDLKLPAGTARPVKDTVTAITSLPATENVAPANPANNAGAPTTSPAPGAGGAGTGGTAAGVQPPLPVPHPAPGFSPDAYNKFNDLNSRYQAELQKPVGTRQLGGLIADYKALAAQKDLPPSVKQGSDARIAALEKLATIQRLQKENEADVDARAAQQKALDEQFSAAEKALHEHENSGPYLAEGKLQTSAAVSGKYALVNPATGRTVAYVDPASPIDLSKLLGEYIGVRGDTVKAQGADINVIQVKTATLLAAPAEVPAGH
jgi:hypothetical protein